LLLHVFLMFDVYFIPGIDAEEARNVEEKVMLEDAQGWLNRNCINDLRDRTG